MPNKKCIVDNCIKCASYNFPGKQAEYCKLHKQNNMIDLYRKHCEYEQCYIRANFGYKNEKSRFCSIHKLETMIDLLNKVCEYDGCNTKATYGYGKTPQFCATHKKEDMTNVTQKQCKFDNCKSQPAYNFKGMSPLYCSKHASENMIDVIHKKCEIQDCIIIPVFGYEKGKATRCKVHKENNMIDVISLKCIYDSCIKQANFNYETESMPKYCKRHKLENMIDIKNKKCPGIDSTGCPYDHQTTKKYDYYCTRCFLQKFPTDPRSALIHKNGEEIKVIQYIQKELPEYSFIHDKPMWIDNCECIHKRRVDLRVLIHNTILAIEIDENQHKYRNQDDETIRYDDLYMIHSGKWIFIRYNPHSYKNHIGKHKNTSSDIRLKILVDTIKKSIYDIQNEKNDELIQIHTLFFDGWNSTMNT